MPHKVYYIREIIYKLKLTNYRTNCVLAGVYHYMYGDELGSHAVTILGWGVYTDVKNRNKSVPYWLCSNTWGPDWGEERGFFRIARGRNECNIELQVIAGLPAS